MDSFRAERAVSPVDGSELWVVLDPGYVVHREASHAHHRISELEDELTAARESLRRLIRNANR